MVGHPRTVVSTQNSQYGKVYAAAPDSPYLTILATLTDLVDTTVLVEGNIVDVRVTSQNGSQGNSNYVSRSAGHGEPCTLPPALLPANATPIQAMPGHPVTPATASGCQATLKIRNNKRSNSSKRKLPFFIAVPLKGLAGRFRSGWRSSMGLQASAINSAFSNVSSKLGSSIS